MNTLTLGYLSLGEIHPLDIIDAAADGGFRSVGLRICGRRKGETFFDILGHDDEIGRLRDRLKARGLRLSNVSAFHIASDLQLADVLPAIEATVALGASLIIANRLDPDDAHYYGLMRDYCDAAAQSGVRLAIEPMLYSETKSLDAARRSLDIIGRANLGLLIDPLHLSRSGGTPVDLARLNPDRIFLAQFCDARGPLPADEAALIHEARHGRLMPGEGDLPLRAFLDALPDGIEIECEIPQVDLAHASPSEKAKRIGVACRSFLEAYGATRPGFRMA